MVVTFRLPSGEIVQQRFIDNEPYARGWSHLVWIGQPAGGSSKVANIRLFVAGLTSQRFERLVTGKPWRS